MSSQKIQLQLRSIQANDKINKLSFGNSAHTPLKIFLKKEALNFHQHNIAKTYVFVDENSRVWGYISLMNSEITLNENQRPPEIDSSKYETFPSVKVARLAIDQSLQGQGYGKTLLEWAVTLIKDKISPQVGCRFLVVDAKRDSVPFYKKMGFNLFDTVALNEHSLMWLDLHHAI